MFSFECAAALTVFFVSVVGSPVEDGRWIPEKYGDNGRNTEMWRTWLNQGRYGESGQYNRPKDEGKYIHIPNPYIHIDNPYDGGYGPYTHDYEPYVPEPSIFKYVRIPPDLRNPFYKEGYYRNNGIKIISQQHNYEEDKYDFDFETENKIRAEEKAVLKNANTIDEGIASKGFYEYIGPDGFMYRVDYTADENGFRPKVKRLETPYSGKWVLEKVN